MNQVFSRMMAAVAVLSLLMFLPMAARAQQPVDHSKMTPEQMQQHGPATPVQPADHSKMTPEQMQQHGPVTPGQMQDSGTMTPEQMLEREQMKDQAAPAADKAPAKQKKP